MECCRRKVSIFKRFGKAVGIYPKEEKEKSVTKRAALVGSPNVGKSAIFNSLTGAYVTVSNYPGTTVEVSRGWCELAGERIEVIDTPGMYSMAPISDEEKVTRKLLVDEKPDVVIHVIDAKNIQRMLPLTLQLMEAGFDIILVLNIMDEAESLGMEVDIPGLEKILGIPAVGTSATLNKGLNELKKRMGEKIKNAA